MTGPGRAGTAPPSTCDVGKGQGVQRLYQGVVAGSVLADVVFYRTDQHVMGSVNVALPVEQKIGGGHRGLQRLAGIRVGLAGGIEQPRYVAQIAGHVSPHVGGFGHSPTPVGIGRAEIGGAEQGGDGAHGIAAQQDLAGYPLK